jgi:hypothetical protein
MGQPKPVSGMRATLLFLLYPLIGEFLFIDTIIKDRYTRRRIRAIFTLLGLAIVAISFAASELIILITINYVPPPFLTTPMRYIITATAALLFLILFIDEGRRGRISLKDQIDVPEDRVSLLINDSRDVFITLNRILNAAQLQRYRNPECENSRLASYALTVLSEYLQTRIFSESTNLEGTITQPQ